MPKHVFNKTSVCGIRSARREWGDFVAWKYRNDRTTLEFDFPILFCVKIIIAVAAEKLVQTLGVHRRFNKRRYHGVDNRRLKLRTLVMVKHFEHRHN